MTHEEMIRRVQEWAAETFPEHREAVRSIKLVYGAGQAGLRGVTYFKGWQNGKPVELPLVEVCAFGEESPIQLAGTTLHELAHVVAGWEAGHGKGWKAACGALGLRCARAAGTRYSAAMLDPRLRELMAGLPPLSDGAPVAGHGFGAARLRKGPRPCTLGVGTRGGKSRGAGSGSRLRKWVCGCEPRPVIVRVASDAFEAHCDRCGDPFKRAE